MRWESAPGVPRWLAYCDHPVVAMASVKRARDGRGRAQGMKWESARGVPG